MFEPFSRHGRTSKLDRKLLTCQNPQSRHSKYLPDYLQPRDLPNHYRIWTGSTKEIMLFRNIYVVCIYIHCIHQHPFPSTIFASEKPVHLVPEARAEHCWICHDMANLKNICHKYYYRLRTHSTNSTYFSSLQYHSPSHRVVHQPFAIYNFLQCYIQ